MTLAVQQWEPNPHGLLWVAPDDKPIRDYNDRAIWKNIQKEAGVAHPSGRAWHLHECRHTFMTMMKRGGADDAVLEQAVGQAKVVRSYVHMDGTDAKPYIAGVESALLGNPAALEGVMRQIIAPDKD